MDYFEGLSKVGSDLSSVCVYRSRSRGPLVAPIWFYWNVRLKFQMALWRSLHKSEEVRRGYVHSLLLKYRKSGRESSQAQEDFEHDWYSDAWVPDVSWFWRTRKLHISVQYRLRESTSDTVFCKVNRGLVYFIPSPESTQPQSSQEVRITRENQEDVFIVGSSPQACFLCLSTRVWVYV